MNEITEPMSPAVAKAMERFWAKHEELKGESHDWKDAVPETAAQVGWELDVTVQEVSDMVDKASFDCDAADLDLLSSYSDFLDLCRSRIRPTFECKECARLRKENETVWQMCRERSATIDAARAALEGE